ncbi:FAA hydrolase family protein [Lysobacter pythonis]|uniref:FAA hydrolase family protein n=1 Tax=Solilutibacter pythonis TaxID=2483112 RepID=A0A3M2HMU2_9GAMM|nr:fumarylacetoacetate hydrolase family protein [Lysobacter pythonis]RMH91031.1 FAA hydrolase family protein [Lysobacter pythonis]
MADVLAPTPPARIPLAGEAGDYFPVRRVYCIGRNFADHAREMGADAPASKAARGDPVFFLKPTDAVVADGVVPYPPGTRELHHEVELVVALGQDAPTGRLDRAAATSLVFGYALGLDLTRRDLQAAAKAKSLPWDTGKSFDACAPVGPMRRAADLPPIDALGLRLAVNAEPRQQGHFADLIWDVPDVLIELSKLYALKAGDLVFMGTPAGVAALLPGDTWQATVNDAEGREWLACAGRVTDRR